VHPVIDCKSSERKVENEEISKQSKRLIHSETLSEVSEDGRTVDGTECQDFGPEYDSP
jgi:hypothetical protein